METKHYSACPACGSIEIKPVMTVKDHSVTGESFPIFSCPRCTLRFTQDVPAAHEIGRYYQSQDYISHTNTSRGIVNRVYKIVRASMLRRKRKLVEKYTGVRKGMILDLGSGVGSFASEMKRSGWQVTGLEPDEGARATARSIYGIELDDTDGFYRLKPESFDAVTLWHVLEHVHELEAYIAQLKTVLKENGRLFIAVPNYTCGDAAAYGPFWAAYDVPRHLYHFSPAAMEALMTRFGLKIISRRPMWFDSFYISLLSGRYKSGRTQWISSLWTGFRSNWKALGNAGRCSSLIYIIRK